MVILATKLLVTCRGFLIYSFPIVTPQMLQSFFLVRITQPCPTFSAVFEFFRVHLTSLSGKQPCLWRRAYVDLDSWHSFSPPSQAILDRHGAPCRCWRCHRVKPWCAASVCGRAKRYTSRWWPWPENVVKWMADDIEGVYIFGGWVVGLCGLFACLFDGLFGFLIWLFDSLVWLFRFGGVAIPKHPCLWAENPFNKISGAFSFHGYFYQQN